MSSPTPSKPVPANLGFLAFLSDMIQQQRKGAPRPVKKFWIVMEYVQAVLKIVGMIVLDAAIELLLVVLFGIIIVKMSQGRDIVVSMFEPGGMYQYVRIGWTLIAITAFSVSMWLIPAFLFEIKNKWSSNGTDAFRAHLFFAHRVLPLIPFWVMAFALFNDSGWWFVAFSLAELIALSLFNEYVRDPKARKLTLVALLIVLLAFSAYFWLVYRDEYLSVKRALAVMLYLFSALLYQGYRHADIRIIHEHLYPATKGVAPLKKYPVNSAFYLLFALAHILIIILVVFNVLEIGIAPESMLLYVFAFYVFLIDIVVYITRLHPVISTGGVLVGLTLVILFFKGVITFNVKHNEIDRQPLPSSFTNFQRQSFEEYYQQWRATLQLKDTSSKIPIILVAGEGGGSRAGYWFSQNMIDLDLRSKGLFRNHVFSISTVSGSTVGLGTYFAYLQATAGNKGGQPIIDNSYRDFPRKVYRNNFVGSSISGLFVTDLFKSVFHTGATEDRNNILVREESMSTRRALSNDPNQPLAECVLDKEYMGLYYDPEWQYKRFSLQFPLSFINTCRSNDGRRGIFAPVTLKDTAFNDAIDINGYIYQDRALHSRYKLTPRHPGEGISFGQACNASELFPLFSAPLYIDSLGSFVDGGYHENSGLKTTIDVYAQLKKLLDKDQQLSNRYVIYILYLKNGSDQKNLYEPRKPTLGITQPLSALMGQPFNGSASYFEEKARYIGDTSTKTIFMQVGLGNKISSDTSDRSGSTKEQRIRREILTDLRQKDDTAALNFPLARWLSVSVIGKMERYQQRYADTSANIKQLLKAIQLAH